MWKSTSEMNGEMCPKIELADEHTIEANFKFLEIIKRGRTPFCIRATSRRLLDFNCPGRND
jgi:hypothetical protein